MTESAGVAPEAVSGDLVLSTVAYGRGGGRPLSLHLLRPPQAPREPLPVLVWIHGGAWRMGNKDEGILRLLPFARRGYACASVEYRLSQEARFPAQITDCMCAVRFLRANAARFSLDPERIGAWGASAGGHLVALLGTAADHPHLAGDGGWADHSSRVQAVCDWFGPTDFAQMSSYPSTMDHDAPDSPEAQLIGGPVQEHPDLVARANPITYVTGDAPPFLIIHGDEDPLVPHHQSHLLYEALAKAGADVTFHTLVGAGHGGPAFEHPATLGLVSAFFDRHLRPGAPAEPWSAGTSPTPATVTLRAQPAASERALR